MERFLNKIICGDCLEVMKDIPDKSIDMILCDLPYGTTACKWDVIIPFEPLWEQYKRLIKSNGAIVLTASQPFTTSLIASNMAMFKYEWIWEKSKATNFLNARKNPMKKHENILVFGEGLVNYFPVMAEGKPYKKVHRNDNKDDCTYGKSTRWNGFTAENDGIRFPSSILKFQNVSDKSNQHPTQKPVALFEYLIKTYTNEGETVLDNCIGSGTTAISAHNTGRFFIGIEKEPKYCEIARQRLEQAQSQQSLFAEV